ncbi:helix-turn-helix domain-containing protein [Nocardia sp. NBC_01009]|uniref:helix-turn-helix domain-containing protein n=1 Tax=Nocardia sp. NBC_01009 TaxID=2975996 RepID=UPI003870CF3F|nr:helix-turn-helix domain-containing protein [Nocardia sp. NBC_01009]
MGRYLRDMRVSSGMSILNAAKAIGRGAGTLQRLETGETNQIHDDDLRALCELYERSDMLALLKALALQGKEPNWWHEYDDVIPAPFNLYVSLEAAAEALTIYRPDLVSGLFQISDYAIALDRVYFARDSAEELDRRVRVRRERQNLITRRVAPVAVDLVIDEAVLHRMVGGSKVMAAQLRQLADMPPNVAVRVLPSARGLPLGISTGPFTVLDFGLDGKGKPLEPSVVYVESYTGDMYLEKAESMRRYREAHETIQRVALDSAESKHLLDWAPMAGPPAMRVVAVAGTRSVTIADGTLQG